MSDNENNPYHGLLKNTDIQLSFHGKNSIGPVFVFFITSSVLKLFAYFLLQMIVNFNIKMVSFLPFSIFLEF